MLLQFAVRPQKRLLLSLHFDPIEMPIEVSGGSGRNDHAASRRK